MQHIRRGHSAQGTNLLNTDLGAATLGRKHVNHCLRPVGTIPEQTEIAERLLGAPEAAFALAELVAECDEKEAVTLALVLRESEDAGDVVALC